MYARAQLHSFSMNEKNVQFKRDQIESDQNVYIFMLFFKTIQLLELN